MKRFVKDRKFLIGLAVSLVLAMAVGSFAIGEVQTPVIPQAETQSLAATNDDTGDFVVSGGSYGTSNDYDFDTAGRVLYIHPQNAETKITISTGSSTTDRIEVKSAATIILAGVDIDRSSITTTEPAALTIVDDAAFNVNIFLKDDTENTLKGAAGSSASPSISGSPGIQKNGDTNVGTLTITGSTGENAGKLEATGGTYAAGIGSSYAESTSNIKITGGNVTATGGYCGAGIGGGRSLYDPTAEEYKGGNGSNITITGGTVTATGGSAGAGIGGGQDGSGSDIKISSGTVTATGGVSLEAGGGAGIGGGADGNGTGITISGGEVIATGKNFGAGIGGGAFGDGTGITISGGSITATGGYIELDGQKFSGAGIGSGFAGNASGNKLNGNAVVLATSGEDDSATGGVKPQLDGFVDDQGDSLITQGIAFTGVGEYEFVPDPDSDDPDAGTWVLKSTTWNEGKQYGGSVKLTEDVTFPADFTITSNAALTVGKNAAEKEATLSLEEGKKLTVEGSLTNKGVIDIPAENLICNGNGKITTLLNYDPQGGSLKTNDDEYIIYQDSDSVKDYGKLKEATKEGYDFDAWYTKKEGKGTKVLEGNPILLNEHTLYANWIAEPEPTPTPPTPTPPGPEPIPTPPGPEPGPEPTPTPEPTPDPSVDPDSGNGSGSSSKTSDPFMSGMALALLGVATTGAILTRKLR